MKIDIANLREGEFFYKFEDNGNLFKDTDELIDYSLVTDVNLFKTAEFILLKINLSGNMKLICDRCLKEFNHTFSRDFELIYRFKHRSEYDISDKDESVFYISRDEKIIDIVEPVRDYFIITVPMKKVPEEKNGICTFCNIRTDEIIRTENIPSDNPVWDKLKKLKN